MPLPASRSAVTDVPSRTSTPARSSSSSMLRAISGSKPGMTCPASDQRDRQAAVPQRLGRLQADEPGTNDHCPAGAAVHQLTQDVHIGNRAQHPDRGQAGAGIGGMTGAAPVDSTSTS